MPFGILREVTSFRLCYGCGRPSKRQRREVPPCKVTNTEEEMRDPNDPNQLYMNIGPQHQEFKPELGPLSRRVETTFLEGIYSENVNLAETDYWFTEPEGGWTSEDIIAIRAVRENTDQNSAANFGPGRTDLHELQEGAVVAGIVNCLMYNHGVQVDLGAQYDGLIPIRGEEWVDDHFRSKFGVTLGVSEDFYVGQAVKVRIHRINHRPRCRFPIQLEVLFPDVQHKISHPDDYTFCFDLRGIQSREEAYAITGRPPDNVEQEQSAYIKRDEIRDLELAQRVPDLSAAAYGQKDIDFQDMDVWDQGVMDLLDSQDMSSLESAFGGEDRPSTVEVVEEEDMYVESS